MIQNMHGQQDNLKRSGARMKNRFFNIEVNTENGSVCAILHPDDSCAMNWCGEFGNWGNVHCGLTRTLNHWEPKAVLPKKELSFLPLVNFEQTNETMISEYESEDISVTVNRYFKDNKYIER